MTLHLLYFITEFYQFMGYFTLLMLSFPVSSFNADTGALIDTAADIAPSDN